ncbi:MAG: glutamine--fructose-6-phosphate transaminase (isomerizing) [Microcoleus sp. PH2017_29_MFU_D_A]|jgi:glutamine---fructose-6-phosphate transaminase (isomerizing)|uniref:glutamine--fructose-6-phosphate transaminase (isomerizing) n=1 Tax=unclassified Microcoleus TaxID=2642155 RepID=UPI001D99E5A9|nr:MULTISPECIES: glutamine--fructose-6-phosphate transaminase (isomerizing) [unclassified Microcoleus]MCC3418198.1 glutamine--fructose-6-phosphate transaminase (isomerizing) [Microcoleus sp. PH2017_07_MST_O_A]MCC3433233.1 glutamine--fructose-6-phosphate transaminase (isomerizing) [Microcoleus sp. PH2017_04_SCI_O_A]MCC3506790.1 glutamine--fructose-6-phosphate transaminase (isomerizing) [Microcoleus sp. PH2017_19_SFW_U_A]MCC3512462.1 glutamine--fructose-6-phosphate transaminase (isomerizing) [Mic
MCGIVGYIGTQAASEILLSGLEKLEYRGYDSSGLATISEGKITCIRAKGKLHNLREKLAEIDSPAPIGIGHTRWATHGKPEEYNAHPHLDNSGRIAVVQNGIVENYRELREELKAKGHKFVSDTDTEVIPHLIAEIFQEGRRKKEEGRRKKEEGQDPTAEEITELSFLDVVSKAVNRLEGAFAIATICADFPDEIIVARQQAPLVIGFGAGEFFCASDTPALISHTRAVLSLENGELARLTPMGVEVYSFAGQRLKKTPRILGWNPVSVEKQGFKHFMHKEIYEQPAVVRACLETYLDSDWQPGNPGSPINLNLPPELCADVEQISILACGTSWHASLIGKYLLEQLANIPTAVQYASEYRYAPAPLTANTLIIGVTQSGETADTLAALGMEQQRRAAFTDKFRSRMLGITNRTESSIAHMMPHIINTHAGIEIGVAATKTFVTQLMAFYFLALDLAHQRQTISTERLAEILAGLRQLPAQIEKFLEIQEQYVEELSHQFTETQDFIFLGRGINFPIALEGALKLKEISYIHAEGYPAGEMKHGPIALLDAKVPVVAIAMPGSVYEKVLSNAQEAKARDARLIGVTPKHGAAEADIFDHVLPVPLVDELLSPIVTVIPLQLLAYHIAARRGLDVDQPRNLAKSVTVE